MNALKRLIESSASGSAASPEEAGTKPDKNDAAAERIASNRSGSIASADTDTQESAVVDGQERGMLDGIILECSGLDELAPVLQVGSYARCALGLGVIFRAPGMNWP